MKKLIAPLMILVALMSGCRESFKTTSEIENNYGSNLKAGKFLFVNGVNLYYEIYGKGDPLILLHGNGGNIEGMKYQIEYFSKNYRVIAMDCRGRGKPELGKDSLSYMQMTKDVASLLDYLHVDSTFIIGRSDGGIIAIKYDLYWRSIYEKNTPPIK